MKLVFTNSMVVRLWAQQTQECGQNEVLWRGKEVIFLGTDRR